MERDFQNKLQLYFYSFKPEKKRWNYPQPEGLFFLRLPKKGYDNYAYTVRLCMHKVECLQKDVARLITPDIGGTVTKVS